MPGRFVNSRRPVCKLIARAASWPALQRADDRRVYVGPGQLLRERWRPDLASGFVKHGKHEALADIYESIDELKYYREHFLRV